MSEVTDRLEAVADRIAGHRYSVNSEAELQKAIAQVLADDARREVTLSATDRVDLLAVDGVGIEVKVAGTKIAALRQCQRYTHSPDVEAVLLVSTKSAHAAPEVTSLGGKPFKTLIVRGGWA